MLRKFVFILLLLFFVVFISGCINQKPQAAESNNSLTSQNTTPIPNDSSSKTSKLKGVSLSPKSFQSADFTGFFEKAKQAGSIVSWAGDWNELGNTNNGGPKVVAELSSNYGYIHLIQAQFFTQSSNQLLRPLDENTKQNYKNYAVAFVEKYKPQYIGFGIEVNILYEKSPQEFEQFAAFYSEIYDTVKEKSPNTKIFTTFQLEKMKGLNGGLFGGKNDPSTAQWPLLDKFPKSDIIAFTTYPGLIYKSPSEIPADYYSEIKFHTSKPIVFTEVGWHSAISPEGWESSEKEQAEFVTLFFNLTQNLSSEFIIWSFLYDQNTIEPFNSMGLFKSDGSTKSAWGIWLTEE